MTKQEMAPPSTLPPELMEEETPAPRTKGWFIADITKHPGKSPNEIVAKYLLAKGVSPEPPNDTEWSAIRDVLMGISKFTSILLVFVTHSVLA